MWHASVPLGFLALSVDGGWRQSVKDVQTHTPKRKDSITRELYQSPAQLFGPADTDRQTDRHHDRTHTQTGRLTDTMTGLTHRQAE